MHESPLQASQFALRNGAEAIVELTLWHGHEVIRKKRIAKNYRNPKLDLTLRSRRTKEESIVLHQAKLAGVLCPRVLLVDPDECEILMEYIQGVHLKDMLDDPEQKRKLKPHLIALGRTIANMHRGKIAHGDLTTKNILVKEGKIHLIDFGLSFFSERIEDRADDLHLLKQALKSSVSQSIAFDHVLRGYEKVVGKPFEKKIAAQINEIERRGRYARVD